MAFDAPEQTLGGRRVLVTGCAGFIGSHLAESLLTDGARVVGVDSFNDNYGRREKLRNIRHLTAWEEFEFTPIDLARGSLEDVVSECDLIFHLAAEPGVRTSWGTRYEQYLRNNVLATQHLLEALRLNPAARFVFASSSSVYGNSELRPTPESAVLRPRSPYGQTKAAMEYLCDLYRENFGLDTVGLKYFTVFGPRQRPDMAFHRICRAAIDGSEFVVFGDDRQTRDFSFVDDIVASTRAAATARLGTERVFSISVVVLRLRCETPSIWSRLSPSARSRCAIRSLSAAMSGTRPPTRRSRVTFWAMSRPPHSATVWRQSSPGCCTSWPSHYEAHRRGQVTNERAAAGAARALRAVDPF